MKDDRRSLHVSRFAHAFLTLRKRQQRKPRTHVLDDIIKTVATTDEILKISKEVKQ